MFYLRKGDNNPKPGNFVLENFLQGSCPQKCSYCTVQKQDEERLGLRVLGALKLKACDLSLRIYG